ncbi:DegV family protein [Streptococcus sp.]|uniref:DegV family protein n=1 Tax=Streptococcus sp. TaxID=1306 RepID=UPI0035A02D4C
MTVKIVTDSSNTMEQDLAQELGITIVPLTSMVDGVVYSDLDLKEGQFLELMRTSKTLPKTSQPPVGLFAEVFSDLASDGSQIIAIHLSHALSGTVEAARQGATLSGADVTVVDSGYTDQAIKFQVVEAARLAKAGASKEEILVAIEKVKEKTELYIGVSTLENLVKGGRIGRVTGLLSSLLNIRVIMTMKDHQLEPVAKGRGNKTFKKWLDEFVAGLQGKQVAEIGISYAGSSAYAHEMKERLQPFVPTPISVLETSSIIQTHTGEDAWAILVRYE